MGDTSRDSTAPGAARPRRRLPLAGARLALSGLLGAVLASCATEPVVPHSGGYPLVEKQRLRVFAGGVLVGILRDLEIEHPDGLVRIYRVETPGGGWVGDVDAMGRFYKNVPFHADPQLVGMFAWDPGLQLMFETEAPIRILPMEGQGAPAEASARDSLREARAAHLRGRR
jgi:hypothetical protein